MIMLSQIDIEEQIKYLTVEELMAVKGASPPYKTKLETSYTHNDSTIIAARVKHQHQLSLSPESSYRAYLS